MADNMEKLRGLFEGGNFPNAQINVINGDGVHISYEAAKHNAQDEGDLTARKQGKEAIMEYVDRLRPVVRAQYLEKYDQIWEGILEINQVKAEIYKKGKQQDTTFNRNLLANIIHQMEILYIPSANSYLMATHLEPDKGPDHPVRQKLGELPDKSIRDAVKSYINDFLG